MIADTADPSSPIKAPARRPQATAEALDGQAKHNGRNRPPDTESYTREQ